MTKKYLYITVQTLFCLFLLFDLSSLQTNNSTQASKVDLIIFSFDRPMQLQALLESIERYFSDVNTTQIIYRASDDAFQTGYSMVQQAFPNVIMHKQSNNPHQDFKPLLLNSVFSKNSKSPYVMFAVDDICIKDYCKLSECVDAMEKSKACGFFLRLGKNITHCYMERKDTKVPRGKSTSKYFIWRFNPRLEGDWKISFSVDMTIYRKKELARFMKKAHYHHPNSFEGVWLGEKLKRSHGIAFKESKIVNVPLNLVNISSNRNMNSISPRDLLSIFFEGKKIDIQQFYHIKNNSPHMEVVPNFIQK